MQEQLELLREERDDTLYELASLKQENKELARKLEEQHREARQAAVALAQVKSQLLANLSHEFKTPMNGLIGMSDLLLSTDLSDEQRPLAEAIHVSAKNLLGLLNPMLDFSNLERQTTQLRPDEFDLQVLVASLDFDYGPIARAKSLRFKTQVDPRVSNRLHGDEERLSEVLGHL